MQAPGALVMRASVRNCQGQAAIQQAEQASSEQKEAAAACTEADTPASSQQAGSKLQSLQPRGARDTGIQLAAANKKDKEAPADAAWYKGVEWGGTDRGEEDYPGDRRVAATLSVQLAPRWLFPESHQAVLARPLACGGNIQEGLGAVLGGFVGSAVCLWLLQKGPPSSFVTLWSASGSCLWQ